LFVLANPVQADVKDLLATDPVIQKLKLFENINDSAFSRADATVLLDRLLIHTTPDFDKDMSDYLNPFGDVNENSDYYNALLRLAYYRGSASQTVITRENNLFRPLDYVSRQEFLKMVLQGFNIPVTNTNNLARFKDKKDLASWAENYFSTAVAQGIIVGDASGNLNPTKNLTTYEALLILDRVVAKYDKAYLHNSAGFDAPEAVNLDNILSASIGKSVNQVNHDLKATPINITDISIEKPQAGQCGENARVLSVTATQDKKAQTFYQWTVSNGYLGKYQGDKANTFQKVCFYPATSMTKKYAVNIDGVDTFGFAAHFQKNFAPTVFDALNVTHNSSAAILSVQNAPKNLTAGQFTKLDLTKSTVKEGGVNVAFEQVDVSFDVEGETLNLFSGKPENGVILFEMPTLENLYGKKGTLTISAHTQTVEKSKVIKNVRYLPQFAINGNVINNETGTKANGVKINETTVMLDENNDFNLTFANDMANKTLELEVLGAEGENSFKSISLQLSYQVPTPYIWLIAETPVADTDHDGMPDEWEIKYGLNPEDAKDALLDFDEDDINNLAEFKAESDPTTAAFLKVTANAGDTQVTLSWKKLATISAQSVCYTTTSLKSPLDCEKSNGSTLLTNQTNPAVINNLINGKKYYFVVTAENTNGSFASSSVITATPKQGEKSTLNDTGITTCSDNSTNGLTCPIHDFPNQDAQVGRDATKNDDSDGHAGFSFTKISDSGATLSASATSWNCVKDNVTGLTWEVKTTDGGLHDMNNRYTWYEPDASKNGGFEGYKNGGSCTGSDCDTNAYVTGVNAAGYCGYKDWRMPTRQELASIVDFSRVNLAIDTTYFPNTQSNWFWSSSPNAYGSNNAWVVTTTSGFADDYYKDDSKYVRLVR